MSADKKSAKKKKPKKKTLREPIETGAAAVADLETKENE